MQSERQLATLVYLIYSKGAFYTPTLIRLMSSNPTIGCCPNNESGCQRVKPCRSQVTRQHLVTAKGELIYLGALERICLRILKGYISKYCGQQYWKTALSFLNVYQPCTCTMNQDRCLSKLALGFYQFFLLESLCYLKGNPRGLLLAGREKIL